MQGIKGKSEGELRSPKSWSKGLFILMENTLVINPVISGRQYKLRASKIFMPFDRLTSFLGHTHWSNVLRYEKASCGIHVHMATTTTNAIIKLHFQTETHRTTPFTVGLWLQQFKEHVPSPEIKRWVKTEYRRRPWRHEKPVSNTAEGWPGEAEEAFNRWGSCPPTSKGKATLTGSLTKNPSKAMGRCSHLWDWQHGQDNNHKCRWSLIRTICVRKMTQIFEKN